MTVVFNIQIKKGFDIETNRLAHWTSVSTWLRMDVLQSRRSKYLKTGRVTDHKLDYDHCSSLETRPCEKNCTVRGVRSSDHWCRSIWCKVKDRIWLKRRNDPHSHSHRPSATVTPPPPSVRQAQIRKHFKPRRPSPSGCKPNIDPTTVFPPARYDVITGITRPSPKTGNPLATAVRVIRFPCHNPAMRFVSTDG